MSHRFKKIRSPDNAEFLQKLIKEFIRCASECHKRSASECHKRSFDKQTDLLELCILKEALIMWFECCFEENCFGGVFHLDDVKDILSRMESVLKEIVSFSDKTVLRSLIQYIKQLENSKDSHVIIESLHNNIPVRKLTYGYMAYIFIKFDNRYLQDIILTSYWGIITNTNITRD